MDSDNEYVFGLFHIELKNSGILDIGRIMSLREYQNILGNNNLTINSSIENIYTSNAFNEFLNFFGMTLYDFTSLANDIIDDLFENIGDDFLPDIPLERQSATHYHYEDDGEIGNNNENVLDNFRIGTGRGSECSICRENIVGRDAVMSNYCNHKFHRDCIEPWINTGHNSCPMCRGRMYFGN